ncbi:MaoC family dehydratase N-terminal domain-containing protein [Amycolatopsis mongoliensis]|uniref:MaoC family dehydratase N-terminal domain-containing protein n=1 Tax=Amycolatopsis mongoliensis TaxID=715475 RepID=A0A9Y2NEK6_9PSEU|nr:MaoC family dehydratase N-terminal domain-containing protein [Amycolatopsis sp. 4-36]WIX98783.1 MaoC family dehydratase N-terminal domain-containing protein [Amycolatopsis sp. 4-36]
MATFEVTEPILPGPAQALASLLGVPAPDGALPLLWHWVYLLDRPAQADLGPDGHPVRNTVLAPPGPGRRRMWAGGRVRTPGELRRGEPATRRSEVLAVREKQGQSGPLTFVTVAHRITQAGRLVVDEEQDIVYRAGPPADARPDDGPEVPPEPGEWSIEVTPTLLFRFSALTYNAHRIHYDRDYCREVEGYPGLLTHGPLQAIAMAEAARARGAAGPLEFEYRLVSPLFDFQGLIARAEAGAEMVTTVRDRSGRRTATGTVRGIGPDRPTR